METAFSQGMFFQDVLLCPGNGQNIVTKMWIIIHIGSSKEFLLIPPVENNDNGVSSFIQQKTIFLDD